MKPRILIIDNSKGFTGAFKSIFLMTLGLRDKFEFLFVTPSQSALSKYLAPAKISFQKIYFLEISKSIKVIGYLPMLLYNSINLIKYCKRNHISIVHVNDLYNMTGVIIKLFHPSIRLIYHVRLLKSSYGGKLFSIWLWAIDRYAEKIIVVSKAVDFDIRPHIKRAPIKLIYDFVPLDEKKGKARLDDAKIFFLYPAHFIQGKGQDIAIRAFHKALTFNSHLHLNFVGGDFGLEKNKLYRQSLEKTVSELGLSNKITFRESSDDIEGLMKSHHVVLNFSESESFSMTCYEAMYFGRPLIASNSGGPGELIDHEKSGLLVENRNESAMTKAILRIALDSKLRNSLETNAPLLLRKMMDDFNAVDRLSEIYSR